MSPMLIRSAQAIEVVADRLTDHGYDIRSPTWEERSVIKITNARAALSELSISDSGAVEWEYRPIAGSQADPSLLSAIMACLLSVQRPAAAELQLRAHPPMSLKGVVGRALSDVGLLVGLAVLGGDDYLLDAYSEIAVTNPARQDRGAAYLADEGAIWWHCRISDSMPGRAGLTLADISQTIAHALTSTHHADPV